MSARTLLVALALAMAAGHESSASPAPVSNTRSTPGTPTGGAPRLIVAAGRLAGPTATPEVAAREHLRRVLPAQGVPEGALAAVEPVAVHDLPGGVHLVHFRQRAAGLDLYRSDVKVMMTGDRGLVAISGSLRDASTAKAAAGRFKQGPGEAVARALSDRFGLSVTADQLRPAGVGPNGYMLWSMRSPGSAVRLDGPAHVKRVLYPAVGGALRPAYHLELIGGLAAEGRSEAFGAVLAGDDGAVLERSELTAYDTYQYRVWAETAGDRRPLDGPVADYTPHPAGAPDGTRPGFTTPSLVSMEGFNHNPSGAADPWLPRGSLQTLGNNVDAYTDQLAPDGFSNGDVRATTTVPGVFDRTYDTAAAPTLSQAQMMAAVTSAFYVTNWLHDYWYDSGFTEAAGNAQLDNHGRGGAGNDAMLVEVQDNYPGGNRNNADMTTLADGFPPRMQLFVWSGPDTRQLTLAPGGTVAAGAAMFGPQSFDVTADVALADDGSTAGASGTTTDACQPLVNDVTARIVLADRGTCSFKAKALMAQDAGASGLLVVDDRIAAVPPWLTDDASITTPITIPAFSMLQADGNALQAALAGGTVSATFHRVTEVERDAAVDALLISHEWGHYLHHRLSDCTTKQCQAMSEGWADFVALHLALREADDLDGTYSISTYAGGGLGDVYYGGIRRFPYSVDPAKNALTLKHLTNGVALPAGTPRNPAIGSVNSEVHSAGEIWATMLWEGYVALQRTAEGPGAPRTFDQVRRLMADYVVSGLLLAPPQATYVEARDALLAAIQARDPADAALVADAFARRGAGTCAVAPAPESQDFSGVVEDFGLKSNLVIGQVRLDDGGRSCDGDGVLDADERGAARVTLVNAGSAAATGVSLALGSTSPGISFPDGATVQVASIAPHTSVEVAVNVALDATAAPVSTVTLNVAVTDPSGCTPVKSSSAALVTNYDDRPAQSAADDVESSGSAWTFFGAGSSNTWARSLATAPNHVWAGIDLGEASDTGLVSPPLVVGAAAPFSVTFQHSYSFETDITSVPGRYYDGGVIELSDDDGSTWRDVTALGAAPSYGGTLVATSGNPLGGRRAYVWRNAAYPAMSQETLSFGTQLAGKTVRLRFRIATDLGVGDVGWRIDNVAASGITNLPFGKLVGNVAVCPRPPLAVAGADRTVGAGTPVLLDASGSSDPDGDPLSFRWTQTSGPPVALAGSATAVSGFIAPAVTADTTLVFQVSVGDGTASSTDSVNVTVQAPPPNLAPAVDAGPDRSARVGETVLLDGSASRDPEGHALAFSWRQVRGPAVTLYGAAGSIAGFAAPEVNEPAELVFELTAGDDHLSARDTVAVTVVPGGGCACSGGGWGGEEALSLALLATAALATQGRRRARKAGSAHLRSG